MSYIGVRKTVLCFKNKGMTADGFAFTLQTTIVGSTRIHKAVLVERSGQGVNEEYFFATKSEASDFFFGVCVEEDFDSHPSWDDWLDENWLTPEQFHTAYE